MVAKLGIKRFFYFAKCYLGRGNVTHCGSIAYVLGIYDIPEKGYIVHTTNRLLFCFSQIVLGFV